MNDRLEQRLEAMNCQDDASLKAALDQLIREESLSREEWEEAVELRLSLEGVKLPLLDQHAEELGMDFCKERAASFKPSGKQLALRLVPMAALLVIVVGIWAFTGFLGRIPADPPLVPPVTEGQTSPAPSSAAPSVPAGSSAEPSSPPTSAPVTSQATVPKISYSPSAGEDWGNGVGGTGDGYRAKYHEDFSGIPGRIYQMVSEEEVHEWAEDETKEKNIYTFLMEFQITKEQVLACNELVQQLNPNLYEMDPEMIEVIYSGKSAEEIYRIYALPTTVVVGPKVYAPEYFVNHSLEEIQKAGITAKIMGERYASMVEACRTYEQAATLTKRLKELQKAEQEKGKSFVPIGVVGMIQEHPLSAAIWLGESSLREWEQEGVSISLVDEHFVNMVYVGKDRRQIAAFATGVKKAKEEADVGGKLSSREEPLFAEYPQITLESVYRLCGENLLDCKIPLEDIEPYLYDILADLGEFKRVGTFMYVLTELEKVLSGIVEVPPMGWETAP